MMIARRGFLSERLRALSPLAGGRVTDARPGGSARHADDSSWKLQFLKEKNVAGAKDYLADDATLIFATARATVGPTI